MHRRAPWSNRWRRVREGFSRVRCRRLWIVVASGEDRAGEGRFLPRFAAVGTVAGAVALVAAGCGGTTIGSTGDPDEGIGGNGVGGSAGGANSGGLPGGGGAAGAGGRASGGRAAGGRVGVGGAGGIVAAGGAGGASPDAGAGGASPDAGAGGASPDAGAGGAGGAPTDAGPNGDGCVHQVVCPPPSCPAGRWPDLNGCMTCACAPPPVGLSVGGADRPSIHLSLAAASSIYIGGIDRWIFQFTWDYDDPAVDDEEEQLTATVRVMILAVEITEQNSTFRYPSPAPSDPMEPFNGNFGAFASDTPMRGVSGFISVRREGDRFVGGVHLEFEPSSGTYPGPILASGPFDVPVPAF